MKITKSAHFDAGGMDDNILEDLLKSVTILSPNETELLQLTGMPTETIDQVVEAAKKLLKMVFFYILFFSLKLLSLFC